MIVRIFCSKERMGRLAMTHLIARTFTAHPAKVGESYFGHMVVALSFAGWLALAAVAAVVHALIPALCERTASNIILRLHNRMMRRR